MFSCALQDYTTCGWSLLLTKSKTIQASARRLDSIANPAAPLILMAYADRCLPAVRAETLDSLHIPTLASKAIGVH